MKNSPIGRPGMRGGPPIITLFTDFGVADTFVGVMRGVILGICPGAQIVDMGHDAARFDPVAAGFALAAAVGYFPAGTVHVVVVDPGVGGSRRPLVVRSDGHLFVAPDNGVLAWVLAGARRVEVRHLVNPRFMRPTISATFHGRDVFAPAAAHLACGAPFARVGPRIRDAVLPRLPRPVSGPGPVLRIPPGARHTAWPKGDEVVLNVDVFAPARSDYLFLTNHQDDEFVKT